MISKNYLQHLSGIIIHQYKLDNYEDQSLYFQLANSKDDVARQIADSIIEYNKFVDLINNNDVNYFEAKIKELEDKLWDIPVKFKDTRTRVMIQGNYNQTLNYYKEVLQVKKEVGKLKTIEQEVSDAEFVKSALREHLISLYKTD
jgi:hypothetical protein